MTTNYIFELERKVRDAEELAATYQKALERIKEQEGKVCQNFTECTHRACNSSYSAWAIADAALGGHDPDG